MRNNTPVKVHTLGDFAQLNEQEAMTLSHELKHQHEGTQQNLSEILIDKKYERMLEFRDTLESLGVNNEMTRKKINELIESINDLTKNNKITGNFLKKLILTPISEEILLPMVAYCIKELKISIIGIISDCFKFQKWELVNTILANIGEYTGDINVIIGFYTGEHGELSKKGKEKLRELLIKNKEHLLAEYSMNVEDMLGEAKVG